MPILGATKTIWGPRSIPGGPGQFLKNRLFFVIFRTIFHYYIVIFQAREPRKITGRHAGKFPEYMVMIRYI